MKKKRYKITHVAQYIGFIMFVSIVRLLPLNVSMLLGKSIAYVFCLIDRKHRKIAYENLLNAYREELSDFQKRKITRRCYQHLASVAIDFVKLPRIINESNWKKHFEVEGLEFARNARKEGRGIIFVSGHIGNWEVLGCGMEFIFHPMYSIAKHMKNPLIDKSYTRLREYAGQKIIFTRNASREMLRVLKNNGLLGILVDQNSRKNSIFVDFFGQKAATTRGVATLSLKTGAPIIMLFSRRIDGRYRFKVSFSKPIQIEKTNDLEKDILNLTQKYTTIIESRIREHPHEWLWIHRRWKTRPSIDSSP